MKKITALILSLVLLILSLASCDGGTEEIVGADNPYKATDTVLETENFSYCRGELSIAFSQYFDDFTYGNENIDFYNIDTETSLKDQIYYEDTTWFDYFADTALSYMTDVLLLCEGAKAAGVELSEADIEEINDAVNSFVRYANDYGYTEKEYFETRFGKDADRDILREYYKKEALAIKYENQLVESYTFTADDLAKAVEKEKNAFYTIDYISYTFDEDKDNDALYEARELAKITDPAEFDSFIISYMTDDLGLNAEEITTKDCYKKCKYYDEYSEFSKKAFEDGAAAGLTYVKENQVDGQYTVYLLTKAPALRTEVTKNIRALAVATAKHDTDAKALTHAEELLSDWKEGETTEASFEKLVFEESDDAAAKTKGGLIEGLAVGDDLPEGLEDWLYSNDVAPGATEIFKDEVYYYVVYLCGDGEIKWERDANALLVAEKYDADHKALSDKYPVEQFEKVINSLDK